MTEALRNKIEEEINGMASKALRTLCVAFKEIKGDEDFNTKDDKNIYELEKTGFVLLGVLGIRDILRQEVKEAVKKCKQAGIKVRMVTGDNKITARAIAIECGIIDPKDENSIVMTGPEFIELTGGVICKRCQIKDCDCVREKELAKKKGKEFRVDTIANAPAFDKIYRHLDVLARSRPEDKYALVTGLIERGCVVAVTGDGTNDAPALKKADVGFAMNSGTDVAKEAADIVLIDDNFASIVKAVMWGRNIYDSIRKYLQFQLTVNIVAVCITVIAAAVLKQEVLTAVQLLYVNLIMDTFASLALATEKPTDKLLLRKPHDRKSYIISRLMMKHIVGQSIFQFIVLLVLVFSGDKWIPEYLPHEEVEYDGVKHSKYYADCPEKCRFMRSGRPFFIKGGDDDYERFIDNIGPSRHYTLIFNTFVMCQLFNFINARKIHDEKNVFEGITRNMYFIVIVIGITIMQIVIGTFGNRPFSISPNGLNIIHWLIAFGIGSLSLAWGLLLKFIPIDKLCPRFGSKMTDPLKPSSIIGIRRSRNEQTLQRKYSSLSRIEGRLNSYSKSNYRPTAV